MEQRDLSGLPRRAEQTNGARRCQSDHLRCFASELTWSIVMKRFKRTRQREQGCIRPHQATRKEPLPSMTPPIRELGPPSLGVHPPLKSGMTSCHGTPVHLQISLVILGNPSYSRLNPFLQSTSTLRISTLRRYPPLLHPPIRLSPLRMLLPPALGQTKLSRICGRSCLDLGHRHPLPTFHRPRQLHPLHQYKVV